MILKRLVVGSFALIYCTGVLAQDWDDDDDGPDYKYAAGIFVEGEQSLYLGGDDQVQVFPYLSARWGRFFFEGGSLGAYIYEDNNWSVTGGISLDGIGDDDRDDSDALADMVKLDLVILGQFEVGYEADWGQIDLTVGADISNAHDGYQAELSYSYPIELGRWIIEPSVNVEWVSKEINQYYYGVTQVDVRPDRPFYQPKSGVNYGAGVTVTYPFRNRHAIVFSAGYTTYSKEVTDSPIVARDNTGQFGLGYFYQF